MYKLYWRSQSSHAGQEEQHAKIEDAIREFKVALTGLYAHSGGEAAIIDENNNDMPLIEWKEGASGGYCIGQAVIDYRPEEDLEECGNEGCLWHNEDSQELCEDCEKKALNICLDRLLKAYE